MDLALIRALLEHTQLKHTGVVEVQGEGARTRLYFANGNLVFADEGTVGETLGRILLREKVIEEADYERTLEMMANAREAKKPARFGEIVVKLGILTQSQVDAALAAQVQHKVLKSIKWVDAKITFTEQAALSEEIARFPTEIEPLIIRSMRVMSEDDKHEFLAEKLFARPKLSTELGRVSHIFRLKTPETRFVELCDGTKTVSELLDAHVPDAVDAELLLCVLDLTKHLGFTVDPAPRGRADAPRRKKKDDAPPSSMKRGRDRSALRSPVWRLTSREKNRIKYVARRLRVRHEEHLSLVPAPQSRHAINNEQGARLVAEQHFRRGRALLRLNKLNDALTALRRAVDLVPMAIEYRLYAAWANFRLLPEKENDRIAPLRLIANRAVKEDPEFGFGYYVLGHLATREGKTLEGSKLLERARSLDPEAVDHNQPLRIAVNTSQRITQKVRVPVLPPRVSTQAMPAVRSEAPTPTTAMSTLVGGIRVPEEAEEAVVATTTPAPSALLKSEDAEVDEKKTDATTAPKSPPKDPSKPVRAPQRASDEPVERAHKPSTRTSARSNRRTAIAFVAVLLVLGAGSVIARDRIMASRAAEAASNTVTAETSTIPSQNVTAPTTAVSAATVTEPSTTKPPTAPTASETATTPSASSSALVAASIDAASATPSPSTQPTSGPMFEILSGTVVPPKWAEGRRVFVDGKSIGEGPGDLASPCGSHVVQIGSGGKPRTVDIPCGGKLEL